MAASSSGVEWGSIVKPILAASYGSFNKNYITELAKAIIRRYDFYNLCYYCCRDKYFFGVIFLYLFHYIFKIMFYIIAYCLSSYIIQAGHYQRPFLGISFIS